MSDTQKSDTVEALMNYEVTLDDARDLISERGECPYSRGRCLVTVYVDGGDIEVSDPFWVEQGRRRIDYPDGYDAVCDVAIPDDPRYVVRNFEETLGRKAEYLSRKA